MKKVIMQGKFNIDRELLDHELWLSEPFTRGQAWVDLIGLANHKPGFIRVRGNKIDLIRGDVGWSKLRLSVRWKWSRNKINNFIKELKNDNRIVLKMDNRISTVISILNYDCRQSFEQQTEQQKVQQKDNRRVTNNNDKNDNNISNTNTQSGGDELVNLSIEAFKSITGYQPTDKKPRNEAYNLTRRIKRTIKEIGKEVTNENVKIVLAKYFQWIAKQDWSSGVQLMGTIRLKYPIYESLIKEKKNVQ